MAPTHTRIRWHNIQYAHTQIKFIFSPSWINIPKWKNLKLLTVHIKNYKEFRIFKSLLYNNSIYFLVKKYDIYTFFNEEFYPINFCVKAKYKSLGLSKFDSKFFLYKMLHLFKEEYKKKKNLTQFFKSYVN